MNKDLRDRLVLPLAVPVVILLLFVGTAFGLSRAMMTVPDLIAMIAALVIGAAVVAFIALRGREREDAARGGLVLTGAVVAVAVVGGVYGAVAGPRESLAALAEEAEAEGEGLFVAIDTDYAEAPTELEAGAQLLTLQNDGGLRHSVSIDELGGQLILAPGGSTVEETIELEPGTYVYYCDIANHRERGMEGELTVTG
jgi:plastocyanin